MTAAAVTRAPSRKGRRYGDSPRRRFIRLRHSLPTRTLAQIRFVYCVLAESRLITLLAIPYEAGRTVVISNRARGRLLRAFIHWMSRHQPDWTAGPDCGGVLTWHLSTHQFIHRHAGYTQQFFAHSRGERISTSQGGKTS